MFENGKNSLSTLTFKTFPPPWTNCNISWCSFPVLWFVKLCLCLKVTRQTSQAKLLFLLEWVTRWDLSSSLVMNVFPHVSHLNGNRTRFFGQDSGWYLLVCWRRVELEKRILLHTEQGYNFFLVLGLQFESSASFLFFSTFLIRSFSSCSVFMTTLTVLSSLHFPLFAVIVWRRASSWWPTDLTLLISKSTVDRFSFGFCSVFKKGYVYFSTI